jgi:hypothetical protein
MMNHHGPITEETLHDLPTLVWDRRVGKRLATNLNVKEAAGSKAFSTAIRGTPRS